MSKTSFVALDMKTKYSVQSQNWIKFWKKNVIVACWQHLFARAGY
jgi:hypothetical protein